MLQTFDADTVLFKILKESADLTATITGGVFAGERPDNSEAEDIVVNTIDLSQDNPPQLGVSNVNIHVADLALTINGRQQRKQNRERLKSLTDIVLTALRAANVEGLVFYVQTQTVVQEAEINQHYVNLRIYWNIH